MRAGGAAAKPPPAEAAAGDALGWGRPKGWVGAGGAGRSASREAGRLLGGTLARPSDPPVTALGCGGGEEQAGVQAWVQAEAHGRERRGREGRVWRGGGAPSTR